MYLTGPRGGPMPTLTYGQYDPEEAWAEERRLRELDPVANTRRELGQLSALGGLASSAALTSPWYLAAPFTAEAGGALAENWPDAPQWTGTGSLGSTPSERFRTAGGYARDALGAVGAAFDAGVRSLPGGTEFAIPATEDAYGRAERAGIHPLAMMGAEALAPGFDSAIINFLSAGQKAWRAPKGMDRITYDPEAAYTGVGDHWYSTGLYGATEPAVSSEYFRGLMPVRTHNVLHKGKSFTPSQFEAQIKNLGEGREARAYKAAQNALLSPTGQPLPRAEAIKNFDTYIEDHTRAIDDYRKELRAYREPNEEAALKISPWARGPSEFSKPTFGEISWEDFADLRTRELLRDLDDHRSSLLDLERAKEMIIDEGLEFQTIHEGPVYQGLTLDADPEEMLHWDLPIQKQDQVLERMLNAPDPELRRRARELVDRHDFKPTLETPEGIADTMTGGQFYAGLFDDPDFAKGMGAPGPQVREEMRQQLVNAGVPGSLHFDAYTKEYWEKWLKHRKAEHARSVQRATGFPTDIRGRQYDGSILQGGPTTTSGSVAWPHLWSRGADPAMRDEFLSGRRVIKDPKPYGKLTPGSGTVLVSNHYGGLMGNAGTLTENVVTYDPTRLYVDPDISRTWTPKEVWKAANLELSRSDEAALFGLGAKHPDFETTGRREGMTSGDPQIRQHQRRTRREVE